MADSGVEFIEEFHKFLSVERGLADTTVVTYLHHVPAYLKFLNNAPTTSITAESALAYFEGLRRRGLRPCTLVCATIAIKTFHRATEDVALRSGKRSGGLF